MLNPEKLLSALNILNDALRARITVHDPEIQRICLVYDEAYGHIIEHLSHPEPRIAYDAFPPLAMCRNCTRN